jgi:hypothetical protein
MSGSVVIIVLYLDYQFAIAKTQSAYFGKFDSLIGVVTGEFDNDLVAILTNAPIIAFWVRGSPPVARSSPHHPRREFARPRIGTRRRKPPRGAATTTSRCSPTSIRHGCCSPPRAAMRRPSLRSPMTSPRMAVIAGGLTSEALNRT